MGDWQPYILGPSRRPSTSAPVHWNPGSVAAPTTPLAWPDQVAGGRATYRSWNYDLQTLVLIATHDQPSPDCSAGPTGGAQMRRSSSCLWIWHMTLSRTHAARLWTSKLLICCDYHLWRNLLRQSSPLGPFPISMKAYKGPICTWFPPGIGSKALLPFCENAKRRLWIFIPLEYEWIWYHAWWYIHIYIYIILYPNYNIPSGNLT